jgi:hypothetical protein
MPKLVKIVLIFALVPGAAIGLWQAHGQRGNKLSGESGQVGTGKRLHEDLAVYVREGSFVLKNLKLEKMMDSTILKGSVVNKTKRKQEQVSFAVRAYNSNGQLLKGLERETIFVVQELKANASTPINHGYGVWLQGIPLESIARIEISETTYETASQPSWTKWLANHATFREEDSEIEE